MNNLPTTLRPSFTFNGSVAILGLGCHTAHQNLSKCSPQATLLVMNIRGSIDEQLDTSSWHPLKDKNLH